MLIVVSSKHFLTNILNIFVKIQSWLYPLFIGIVLWFWCFDILSMQFGYYFLLLLTFIMQDGRISAKQKEEIAV